MVQMKVRHAVASYPHADGGLRVGERGDVVDVTEGPDLDRLVSLGALVNADVDLEVPEPERREKIPLGLGGPVTGPVGSHSLEAKARVEELNSSAEQHTDAISHALEDIDDITAEDADARDDEVIPGPALFPALPTSVAKPVRVAPKQAWVDYAASLPGSPSTEELDKLTKVELFEKYGR